MVLCPTAFTTTCVAKPNPGFAQRLRSRSASVRGAAQLSKCPDDVPQALTYLGARNWLNCFAPRSRSASQGICHCLGARRKDHKKLHSIRIKDSWRVVTLCELQKVNVTKCCNGRTAATDPLQSPASDLVRDHPIRTLLLDNYDSYTYNLFQLLSVVNGVAPVVLRNDEITWDELYHLLYEERAFHNVVISPGPGSPSRASDVGVCNRLLQECDNIPILGVCLGHQALGFVHGAQILHAPEPVHGRLSDIEHSGHPLFASIPSGVNSGFKVVRYHSLVIDAGSLPEDLVPTAWAVAENESESIALGTCPVGLERSTEFSSNGPLIYQDDGPSSGEGCGPPGSDDASGHTLGGRCTRLLMGVSHRSRPHHGVQFHPESVATAYGKQLLLNFRSMTMKFWEEQRLQPVVQGKAFDSFISVHKDIFEQPEVRSKGNVKPLGTHSTTESLMKSCEFYSKRDIQSIEATGMVKSKLAPHGAKVLRLHYQKLAKLASRAGGSGALFNKLFAEEDVEDTFWLDSSSLEQGRARFSFMGGRGGSLWQRITYRIANDNSGDTHGGVLRFQNAAGKVKETVLQGGFLDFLDMELKLRQCIKEDYATLPFNFCGGFIGYLGYELKGECGAKSNGHKSSMPDAGMFLVDRMVVIDHKHDDVYVLAAFEDGGTPPLNGNIENDEDFLPNNMECSSNKKYGAIQSTGENKDGHSRLGSLLGTSYIPNSLVSNGKVLSAVGENQCERIVAETWVDEVVRKVESLAQQHVQKTNSKAHHLSLVPRFQVLQPDASSPFVSESSKAGYIRDVKKCQDYIKDGESYEVCLTTRLRRKVGVVDALGLYFILRETNPAPYSSWLHFGKDGPRICSSSPERFLQLDGQGFLEAKPIKGTAARGDNPLEDEKLKFELQNSKKDQAENLMIVDLLRNDLGRVCEPGSVHVPSLMSVESYSTVHTMVSTVRGKKRPDVSAVDCVRAAFPGGSMTGAPKLRTMEIIDSLEHSPRGVYSGSIGYFSFNSSFDLNIVIRTIVLHDGEASIGAGGAVVALSDPVAEYDEMLLKTKAPVRAVSMYETALQKVDSTK